MKRKIRSLAVLFILTLFHHTHAAGEAYVDSIASVEINWAQPSLIDIPGNQQINVLSHPLAIYEKRFQYLPVIRLKLQNVEVDSVELVQVEYEPLSDLENTLLQQKSLDELDLTNIRVYNNFKNLVSEITIVPFEMEGENTRKISRFTLKYFYSHRPLNDITGNFYKNSYRRSVLAEGEWVKIGATQDGVYKITGRDLKKYGLTPAQIDPETIRIFGNGGKLLPQSNASDRFPDLVENAIMVVSGDDGRFDDDDYILFYGQGPDYLGWDPSADEVQYQTNYYSDTSYYFLNVNQEKGKRVGSAENIQGNFPTIDVFDDFKAHEKELINFLQVKISGGSGRKLYGEKMGQDNPRLELTFDLPGTVQGSQLRIISSLMASSLSPSTFTLAVNGVTVGQQFFDAIPKDGYQTRGIESTQAFHTIVNAVPGDGKFKVSLNYDNPADYLSQAYLDYLIVHARRKLQLYGDQTAFISIPSLEHGSSRFEIGAAKEGVMIWNVSDPLSPEIQQNDLQDGKAVFGAATSDLKKFVVFDAAATLLKPEYAGAVPNQDLHGQPTPDMVIVTHPKFLPAAGRLADFRRSHDGLTVTVATIDQVYNEFSSGSCDVTAIRDYMKYLYDGENGSRLKYLLLVGKGTFDYKNITGAGTNFVPIYQSRNSIHPINSYSSDDYYGFLDDDEGEWREDTSGDHLMDIGVGRFPVVTLQEAEDIVSKLIHYDSAPEAFGDWRKEVFFIADDEDNNAHQLDADKLATYLENDYDRFNVNKLYLDAFPQQSFPTGEKAPRMNQALNEMIEKGALIVNYTGHGNMDQWADEQIFDLVMINNLKNLNKLPLFVTATCEFGRHDHATKRSGGEYLLINPNGGAIGLVTTSRAVYSNDNYTLNKAFYRAVFELIEDFQPTMGQIFRYTKNNSLNGSRNRNFSLLGDPSMTLAYPQKEVEITAITAVGDEGASDTLKALQRVRVEGRIANAGQKVENFRGVLNASVFDKQVNVTTFGNKSPKMVFKQWQNVIFKGESSIKEGLFSFEFVVPKNISYELGDGKISLYAYEENHGSDASGANNTIKIGGSVANPTEDNVAPEITLFMNDTTFRNGGMTSSDALLIAKFYDQSGINISKGGIGQEIYAVLDDEEPIVLNDFYQSEIDSFQKGWIRYPLTDLEAGVHTITLKAWDAYNNSNTARIEFEVGGDDKLVIRRARLTPNPFAANARLLIEHNRAGDDLDVLVRVYSNKGELVGSFINEFNNSESVLNVLNWNGFGQDGKKLETGLYLFKVFVRSLRDGASSHSSAKAIFVN